MAQQNNRARQQRQMIVILLIVMLLIGGGLYVLLGGNTNKGRANNPPPPGSIGVPVANRNINIGERINVSMIRMAYKAAEKVPEDALLKPDQFLGHYATKPILAATHFKEENVSESNVEGGYSALASPGKRIVIVNAMTIPGAIGTLRVGDHIDLLAISANPDATDAAPSGPNLGGNQPGARPPRRGQPAGIAKIDNGVTASLVAEDAEVLRTPARGKDREFVVLQMSPQNAHVTTLMIAAGATMRVVFRPSTDDEKITTEKDLSITTRIPKLEPDPDKVAIIMGTKRTNTVPGSSQFSQAEKNPNYNPDNRTVRSQNYSDTAQAPIQIISRDYYPTQVYE